MTLAFKNVLLFFFCLHSHLYNHAEEWRGATICEHLLLRQCDRWYVENPFSPQENFLFLGLRIEMAVLVLTNAVVFFFKLINSCPAFVFPDTGSCAVRWENKSMYCIVNVFGLAV